jgi:hypothetical protein
MRWHARGALRPASARLIDAARIGVYSRSVTIRLAFFCGAVALRQARWAIETLRSVLVNRSGQVPPRRNKGFDSAGREYSGSLRGL